MKDEGAVSRIKDFQQFAVAKRNAECQDRCLNRLRDKNRNIWG